MTGNGNHMSYTLQSIVHTRKRHKESLSGETVPFAKSAACVRQLPDDIQNRGNMYRNKEI
jgi:hypothetical protein